MLPMLPSSWPERAHRARLALAALVAVTSAAVGCGTACDTSDPSNPPEFYGAGVTTDGVYESSSWRRDLLPFPGGKQYKLEHRLGFTPASVDIYIAFAHESGLVSLCAGNSCLVCADSQFVWIKNDTCANFFVRVVASERSFKDEPSLCDAADSGAPPSVVPDGSTDDGSAAEDVLAAR